MIMKKKFYIIAIGGAAMHNIALDLHAQGHDVQGSDDEIYEPSNSRLAKVGLMPSRMGWYPERITKDIDVVILGMHAKADNPELLEAKRLNLEILSYPAFVYRHSIDKTRLVIAGSHGKTSTTAMILHVLKKLDMPFDYLVGAQLQGFDRMVSLTDAPLIVIEGDEYLSSPVDRVPKIHHYRPHIGILTGIAWDHINVFPTFELYKDQFSIFLKTFEQNSTLVYCETDHDVCDVVLRDDSSINKIPYNSLQKGKGNSVILNDTIYDISIIGNHNLQNMNAAMLACYALGITNERFLNSIGDFKGAAKRLQLINESQLRRVYLDFAHAPSKVKATTSAVKDWYGDQLLFAVLELHTFSSLNKSFLHQYSGSLDSAESACIYYDPHTLQMKNMELLEDEFILRQFSHPNIKVFSDKSLLLSYICSAQFDRHNVLLMTSGTFSGMDLKSI
jgi:UDP-N-acetylmuramate: L-alanyl-gamma-D-glutamyl-meso-diaminopimelate ligase